MGVTGGTPVGFDVGAPSDYATLPGLDLGVRGMRVGGQRKLLVPPNLVSQCNEKFGVVVWHGNPTGCRRARRPLMRPPQVTLSVIVAAGSRSPWPSHAVLQLVGMGLNFDWLMSYEATVTPLVKSSQTSSSNDMMLCVALSCLCAGALCNVGEHGRVWLTLIRVASGVYESFELAIHSECRRTVSAASVRSRPMQPWSLTWSCFPSSRPLSAAGSRSSRAELFDDHLQNVLSTPCRKCIRHAQGASAGRAPKVRYMYHHWLACSLAGLTAAHAELAA